MEKARITADYHTHTVHSHGTGGVDDNIERAIELSLEAIAISDHGPGHFKYNVRDMDAYVEDISRAKLKYSGKIKVLSSIECNLCGLDGSVDMPSQPLDMHIMGFHKLARMSSLGGYWHFYVTRMFKHIGVKKTTRAYLAAIDKYDIDIISHPGYAVECDLIQLGRACRDRGILFEINQKNKEQSPDMLRRVAETGCKFVISSDAHRAEDVAQVNTALQKALEAGLTSREIVNLSGT